MNEVMDIVLISIFAGIVGVVVWIMLLVMFCMAPEKSRWRVPEPLIWTPDERRMLQGLLYALRLREDAGYNVTSDVVLLNRSKYRRIIEAVNDRCPEDQYLLGGIRAVLTDDTNDWRLVPRAKIFELGE